VSAAGVLVKDLMQTHLPALTPAERQLAAILLQDYPIAGLRSITELAATAQVSTPTVVRMARKLGFSGFSDLQEALRAEISAQIKKPIAKLDDTEVARDGAHRLDRMTGAALENLQGTLSRIDRAAFDAAAHLLAEPDRRIFVEGGRITRANADYLYRHLQIVRPGVTALGGSPGLWPQTLLDMDATAVLVVFDIRRYESDLRKLAQLARARSARIVLFTDQWGSPIAADSDHVFHALVEAPSSWDSTLGLMLIAEALIAEVQTLIGAPARARIEALEGMFTHTRMFRDFN